MRLHKYTICLVVLFVFLLLTNVLTISDLSKLILGGIGLYFVWRGLKETANLENCSDCGEKGSMRCTGNVKGEPLERELHEYKCEHCGHVKWEESSGLG